MAQVLGLVQSPISESAQLNGRQYKCDVCGKNYSSANSLKTHIKWHTGDLKHQCNFCEKKFRNHSELRRHEMVHTGERPNKCSHCEKQFIQKHALKDHMRKRHPDAPMPEALGGGGGPSDLSAGHPADAVTGLTQLQQQQPAVTTVPIAAAAAAGTPIQGAASTSAGGVGNMAVTSENVLAVNSRQVTLSEPTTANPAVFTENLGTGKTEKRLTCRFCQEEFKDQLVLLEHEEREAQEFEALHDSFEKKEFGELESFSLQEYLGNPDMPPEQGTGELDSFKNNNNIEKLEYINIDLETLNNHVVPNLKLETVHQPSTSSSSSSSIEVSTLQLKNEPQEFFLKRAEPVILQQKVVKTTSTSDNSSILSNLLSATGIASKPKNSYTLASAPSNQPPPQQQQVVSVATNHLPPQQQVVSVVTNAPPHQVVSVVTNHPPPQQQIVSVVTNHPPPQVPPPSYENHVQSQANYSKVRHVSELSAATPVTADIQPNYASAADVGKSIPVAGSSNSSTAAVGPTKTIALPILPLPLRSIDPGKIPLNINLDSLNEKGLPCKTSRSQDNEDASKNVNTAEFFSSLQKKYNYLDLKLGFPASLSSAAFPPTKIETDSSPATVRNTPGPDNGFVSTSYQAPKQQTIQVYPEPRVMSLSELGFVQTPSTSTSASIHLGKEVSPASIHLGKEISPATRCTAIKTTENSEYVNKLPFAQKSTPAVNYYAVKEEVKLETVETSPNAVFIEIPPSSTRPPSNNYVNSSNPQTVQGYTVENPRSSFHETATVPVIKESPVKEELVLKEEMLDMNAEEFSFIAIDSKDIQQLAINTQVKQDVKTDDPIKIEQETIRVDQEDIGAFCQGLLSEMDNSTWNQINIAEFQLPKPGIVQQRQLVQQEPFQQQQQLVHQQLAPQQQQQQVHFQINHDGDVFTAYAQEEYQQHSTGQQQLIHDQQQLQQQVVHHHQLPQLQQTSWSSDSPTIPHGWMIKYVDYLTGNKIKKKSHFLSPQGDVFESRKEAIDYLIRTNADEADINIMKKGLKLKGSLEWKEGGEDVPKDWKIREIMSSDKKLRTFFLSPGGLSFPCRQAAYDHMVKVGTYSTQDMVLMRNGIRERMSKSSGSKEKLFLEGDPSLPHGWKSRINSQGRENFRSPSGQFFHTRQAIVDYMVQENFPQDQIDLVSSKIVKKSRSKSNSVFKQAQWRDNDPTVPVNWKIKQITTSEGLTITTFLTPEGVTIRGRKAALTHMLKTGLYPKEDVELMRQYSNVLCKVSDTWVSGDPSLPAGWRIRKYNSKPTSKRVHCDFLSPELHVIRSRKGVLEHMRRTGGYSDDDFRRVEQAQNKPERRKTEDMEPRPAPATPATTAVRTGRPSAAPAAAQEAVWSEANFLPPGWMEREGTFMSPAQQMFWSVNEVMEHLENSGSLSQLELARLRKLLTSQQAATAATESTAEVKAGEPSPAAVEGPPLIGRGWKLCVNLPKGWRIKTHFWGNREKHLFRSPEGKVFNSRKLAVEYVESIGTMSPEDLDKLRSGPKKRKKKENLWVNGKRRKASVRNSKSENGPSDLETTDAAAAARKVEKKPKKVKPAPPPPRNKMLTRNSGRTQEGKYESILAGNDAAVTAAKSSAGRDKEPPAQKPSVSATEPVQSDTATVEKKASLVNESASMEDVESAANVNPPNQSENPVKPDEEDEEMPLTARINPPIVMEPVRDIMEMEDTSLSPPPSSALLQCKAINPNPTDVFLKDELDKSMEEVQI